MWPQYDIAPARSLFLASLRFSGTGVFTGEVVPSGAFTGDHVFFGDQTLASEQAGAVGGGGGGRGTESCNRALLITCQPRQFQRDLGVNSITSIPPQKYQFQIE